MNFFVRFLTMLIVFNGVGILHAKNREIHFIYNSFSVHNSWWKDRIRRISTHLSSSAATPKFQISLARHVLSLN